MDATQLGTFVVKTFSGYLSHINMISLTKFLAKQHKLSSGTPTETFFYKLAETLGKENFFQDYLKMSKMDMVIKYFEVLDKLPSDIVSLLMGMQEGAGLSQEKSNIMESVMQRQASDMKLIGNGEEDEDLHHQELCPQ